jgi:hypothetical protein
LLQVANYANIRREIPRRLIIEKAICLSAALVLNVLNGQPVAADSQAAYIRIARL